MPAKVRVWILTYMEPSRGSGVERFVSNLSAALSDGGYEVRILDATSLTSEQSIQKGVRPFMAWKLGRLLNRSANPEDIVICNGYFSWNAKVGRPIVVFHGTELGRAKATRMMSGRLRNLAVRTINARLDRKSGVGRTVVAVSAALKREIEDLYGIRVDAVIPNGIDLNMFRPAKDKQEMRRTLGLPLDKFLILYAGPPDARKGFDFLMNEVRPRLRASQRLVLTVRMEDPPDGVIPLGWKKFDEIVKCYQACDASVVPSYYEGFGYAFAEALACGIPSVVSNVGGATDLLGNDVLSRYVMTEMKAEEYVRSFTELEQSAEKAKLVSESSRRYAEKHFDIQGFNKSYVDLVNTVAKVLPGRRA
jgi:glycosyltransferase involved in cell wall biosynthesis